MSELAEVPKLVMQASIGRLYPTAAQVRAIARIGGQCRALWNHWLAVNRDKFAADGTFVFYHEMSAALPAMRREERFIGLPSRAAQMTVQKLDRALRECGRRAKTRKGFPRFKRHDDRRDAFQFVGGREIKIERDRVRLPVLGWLRVRGLNVPGAARLIQATVRQDRGGWSLAIQFEASAQPYPVPPNPAVGIDVGLTSLITLSDGTKVAAQRLGQQHAKRIRRLEREKARRRKGSVNRRRTVAKLNREHARLAARRKDFTHKLTRSLIDRHEGVAVETLSLKGLMRTRLAKSFADAGLGEFRRQLAYKATWAGRTYAEMPTFQRSTGVCPDCGIVGPRLALSVRAWRCAGCGAMHDRDVAAAQVILIGAVGRVTPEPAGDSRRRRGAAVRGGAGTRVSASHSGPPANDADVRVARAVS